MPKNIFLMSFLYVFIACAVFIAATVHSAPIGEETAVHPQAVTDLKDCGGLICGKKTGSTW